MKGSGLGHNRGRTLFGNFTKETKAMFIDQAKVYVRAGNGGNGMVSFHTEKYVPNGEIGRASWRVTVYIYVVGG